MAPDPGIEPRFCAYGCRNRSTHDCNSGASCRIWMGCAKCGCRMLTKVGRRQPMLICCDCGQPVSEEEAGERRQRLLSGSLFMVGLAAVASMTLLLTHLRDPSIEGSPATEQQGETAAGAAE